MTDLTKAAAALGRKGGLATRNQAEAGALGGRAGWAKLSAEERSAEMKRRAAKRDAKREIAAKVAAIDALRVAAGVCRHCGGAVPCPSDFGDVSVGRRHPRRRKLSAARKRKQAADE